MPLKDLNSVAPRDTVVHTVVIRDTVWITEEVEGTDDEGNSLEFSVLVLSKEFSWAFRRSDLVELHGQPVDMVRHLSTPGMRSRYLNSQALIAVGASSEEGESLAETRRSKERAEQLVVWLREAAETPAPLFYLTLGQYARVTGGDPRETSGQRRVVILSITGMDSGTNVTQALQNALRSSSAFPFNLDDFPTFDLEPASHGIAAGDGGT